MKWVLGILVIGVLGYFIYRWTRPVPERRGCARMVELCGGGGKAIDECIDGVKKVEKVAGKDAADSFAQCTAESKRCQEALGCAAGAAFRQFDQLTRDFDSALGN